MDRNSSLGPREEQRKTKQATDGQRWSRVLHLEGLCGTEEGRWDQGHWMIKGLGPDRKDLKLVLEARGALGRLGQAHEISNDLPACPE